MGDKIVGVTTVRGNFMLATTTAAAAATKLSMKLFTEECIWTLPMLQVPLIDILPSGSLTALPLHCGHKSPKTKHQNHNNSASSEDFAAAHNNSASSEALAAGHVDKANALARAKNPDAPLLLVKLAMEAKLTQNNCFRTKKLGLSLQANGHALFRH